MGLNSTDEWNLATLDQGNALIYPNPIMAGATPVLTSRTYRICELADPATWRAFQNIIADERKKVHIRMQKNELCLRC